MTDRNGANALGAHPAPVLKDFAAPSGTHASQSRWIVLFRLLRPVQWIKNAVVLAGVVFSGRFDERAEVIQALLTLVAFCFASSAVYVFNDWHDREEDRRHPTKWSRPIAAGVVPTPTALTLAASAAVLALGLAATVSWSVVGVIFAYLSIMALYTIVLRSIPIIDLLIIASGFILRALAGAVAVNVPLSSWLFACTLLLALSLGLGKRRHELRELQGETLHHRRSLAGYARLDLERLIVFTSLFTIIAYAVYSLAVPTYGRSLPMIVTLPFVVVSIWRYLYLVLRKNQGGSPELLVIKDRPLFGGILLWAISVAIVFAS